MNIGNELTYQRHQQDRTTITEVVLTAIVFASMGAITWAIRGTAGWNGIDGTIVPGLTWGILWWYVCWRKGIDARGIPLWLGLGIAMGGELGYGQYVSWIRSMFEVGDEVVPIAPWIGYTWFAVCGVGWAAPGAIGLGWAITGRKSLGVWLPRLIVPIGIAILTRITMQAWPWLFLPKWDLGVYVQDAASVVAQTSEDTQRNMILMWLGSVVLAALAWSTTAKSFRSSWPARAICIGAVTTMVILLLTIAQWLFFPGDQLGIFSEELGRHAGRTVYTNSQNAIVVGWWIGALLVACFQRDRFTLFAGLVIGLGFGVGFPLSAVWCLGYTHAPGLVDWWKMWELHAGFHMGLLYVIVLYWSIRQNDKDRDTSPAETYPAYREWTETFAMAGAAFLLIHVASREDFLTVGILLGMFYVLPTVIATAGTNSAIHRKQMIAFAYSVFLLVFIMAWGASSQTGIVLGLYGAKLADQYAWPAARIVIFVPVGILIVCTAILAFRQCLRKASNAFPPDTDPAIVSVRMVDLITFTGVVGAATIWPAKIGVLYAFFIGITLFAFNRLNRHFDRIDSV